MQWMKNNIIITIFGVVVVILVIFVICEWEGFLCFGDKHPWLLQGFIQGIIAGALINLLIWWLNTRKDRSHYKNLTAMLAMELDYNLKIIFLVEQGGPTTPLKAMRIERWNTVQYELAKYLSSRKFQEIVKIYECICCWKAKGVHPNEKITDIIDLTKKCLDYLVENSGVVLPGWTDEEFKVLISDVYENLYN